MIIHHQGRALLISLIIILLLAGVGLWLWQDWRPTEPTVLLPIDDYQDQITDEDKDEPKSPLAPRPGLAVWQANLTIPWDIAELPDGSWLVTERPGRLLHISPVGEIKYITLPQVAHIGEGGLLGLALHPDFADNNYIYLYMTVADDGNTLLNNVFRYQLVNGQLARETVIMDNIPGARFHDGGRLEFGPDGYLYITTGDAENPIWAQDLNSLAGKILRVTADGDIPADNPWAGSPVYSLGHRNPQGLAWDSQGRLWSTEHGPVGFDEINLIVPGGNYGWPRYKGDVINDPNVALGSTPAKEPVIHSGPAANDTWAPGSLAYWDGSLWFGGLRGASLFEAVLDGERIVELKQHLTDQYGRIRTVRIGTDDFLYLTTSNRDGRGQSTITDDRIIKLDLRKFRQ